MTRIQKLEAVALAAKKFRKQATEAFTPIGEKNVWDALDEAIKALDACPQAEPVEGRPERPKWLDSIRSESYGYTVALEAYATTLEQRLGVKP